MSMKAVKCYNSQKKGHLAKDCTEPKMKKAQATRWVNIGHSDRAEQKDLWLRTVTTQSNKISAEVPIATRGPTYKVDIVVDKVKTQALLDHGAQVSLARCQLLRRR